MTRPSVVKSTKDYFRIVNAPFLRGVLFDSREEAQRELEIHIIQNFLIKAKINLDCPNPFYQIASALHDEFFSQLSNPEMLLLPAPKPTTRASKPKASKCPSSKTN